MDRDQHDREQTHAEFEQLERFGNIADKLGAAISESENQFNKTMTQINANIRKSDQIALGVKEDEEAITGRKSYPFFQAGSFNRPVKAPSGGVDAPNRTVYSIPLTDSDSIPNIAHAVDARVTLGTWQFNMFTLGGVFTEKLELTKGEDGYLHQEQTIFKNGVLLTKSPKAH